MKEETLDGFCEHCLRPVTVTVKAAILSLPSLHKSGTCFEHPCTSQKAAVLHLPPFRGVLPGHWALNWRVHFYQKPTKHKETRNVIFCSELPDGQRQSKGSTAPCSPSPASLKELKLIISATTQGNSKKTFDQLFSHYSSHSPRMYTLQLKYMGLILLMILNMCINALLNWSQLKQKKTLCWWKRDVYQLNTESSHLKSEPHLRILQGLLAQYFKHFSFWGFELKFRNFQKQTIKWTCFIKVSQLRTKIRILKLPNQSKESWLLYVLTKENLTTTTSFPHSMKGCYLILADLPGNVTHGDLQECKNVTRISVLTKALTYLWKSQWANMHIQIQACLLQDYLTIFSQFR